MCLKAEVKQHSISLKQDKRGPGSKLAITANRSLSEVVRTQNEKKNSLQIKVLATMDIKIWECVGLQYRLHKTKKLHSKTNMNEKEIWELEINMFKIYYMKFSKDKN